MLLLLLTAHLSWFPHCRFKCQVYIVVDLKCNSRIVNRQFLEERSSLSMQSSKRY